MTSPSHLTAPQEKRSTPPPKPSTNLDTSEQSQPELTDPSEMGVPLPDGAGGLVLPNVLDVTTGLVIDRSHAPLSFPARETSHAQRSGSVAGPSRLQDIGDKPVAAELLPEIGRLAREIVRNGEEKLALAIGAYNSVCRFALPP
jgi:hypothetical protein